MIRVGIIGGTGKLGKELIDALLERTDIAIGAVVASKQHPSVGSDIGLLIGKPMVGIQVSGDLVAVADRCEVLIDCTNAEGFTQNYAAYQTAGKPLIIATTGFDADAMTKIAALAHDIPVLMCPNFSIGVYKFLKLVQHAAREFGQEMDITIVEAHHKFKKDMPSGTAKQLAEVIQGKVSPAHGIPIQSIRAGNIVGEHTVLFVSDADERIELSHKLFSRKSFAQGIIIAVTWIAGKANGLYGIDDLLQGGAGA